MGELYRKYGRVAKFGAVGCVNTLVDFLAFSIATEILLFSPAASQSVSYCSGIVSSFLLNHFVTFSDAKKEGAAGEAKRFVRFIVVNGFSWLISTVMMYYLTQWGMWRYMAKIIVTGATMVINYFGYKILVFNVKGG